MELLKELVATGAITLEDITKYLNSLGHTVLFDDNQDLESEEDYNHFDL